LAHGKDEQGCCDDDGQKCEDAAFRADRTACNQTGALREEGQNVTFVPVAAACRSEERSAAPVPSSVIADGPPERAAAKDGVGEKQTGSAKAGKPYSACARVCAVDVHECCGGYDKCDSDSENTRCECEDESAEEEFFAGGEDEFTQHPARSVFDMIEERTLSQGESCIAYSGNHKDGADHGEKADAQTREQKDGRSSVSRKNSFDCGRFDSIDQACDGGPPN